MVFFHGDESHGYEVKPSTSNKSKFCCRYLVGGFNPSEKY